MTTGLNFFPSDPEGARRRWEVLKRGTPEHTQDYRDFGYDYFDNPDSPAGYHGYHYDGRFGSIAQAMIEWYGLTKNTVRSSPTLQNTVLEIGCAKGHLLHEFYLRQMVCVGVDISEYVSHMDEQKYPTFRMSAAQYAHAAVENHDPVFGLTIAKEVLPHIWEQDLPDMMRRLAEKTANGYLLIQTGRTRRELDAMERWDGTHKTIKPPEWWEDLLAKAGWTHDYDFKILFPEEVMDATEVG